VTTGDGVARVVALLALVTVIAAGWYLIDLLGLAFGWPLFGLTLLPAATAVLLVIRPPGARGFQFTRGLLLLTAGFWGMLPLPFLLALAFGAGGDELPSWIPSAIAAMFVAAAAGVVAVIAGGRYLQGQGAD
jgi:hypothetical protein